MLPDNITEFNLTIGQDQTQNLAQEIGPEGTTLIFQPTEGTIVVYGSATVENPNSALNDFNLTATEGQGSVDIFIGTEFFNRSSDGEFFNRSSDGDSRRRRQVWRFDLPLLKGLCTFCTTQNTISTGLPTLSE